MKNKPEDICPQPSELPHAARSLAPPIYPGSVYRCDSPEEAQAMLEGDADGYVYSRDRHPNADMLSEKCRLLHGSDHAVIVSSGMAALGLALLSQTKQGDHIVVSHELYGRSTQLFLQEAPRLGITCSAVDTCDAQAVATAFTANTRLLIVETITNPMLRVVDIAALAELCHQHDVLLVVDNTFASPIVCRPHALGADLVVESMTKIMNGHSDGLLGLLTGTGDLWQRVADTRSIWGWAASPMDCWLVQRGLGTLALRAEKASANALAVATFLGEQPAVQSVSYPGLTDHPAHELSVQQFDDCYGSMVVFTLAGGINAARALIKATSIPFCPSLGEISTTLTHPATTSHRSLPEAECLTLGIEGGTIRLSVGIESADHIQDALSAGIAGIPA